MTKHNNFDVFFHMRNHYRKILNAKPVVDTAQYQEHLKRKISPSSLQNKNMTPEDLFTLKNVHYPYHSLGLRKHSCYDTSQEHDHDVRPVTRRNPSDMPDHLQNGVKMDSPKDKGNLWQGNMRTYAHFTSHGTLPINVITSRVPAIIGGERKANFRRVRASKSVGEEKSNSPRLRQCCRASSPVHTAMSAASKSVSSRSVSPPSRATSPVGMCISSTGKCISTGSPAVMYVPSSPNYVPPIPKYVSPSPKSVPPGSRNGLPAETKISLSNRPMPPTYRPISPTYIPISPTTTETGSLNTKALKNSVAEHEYLQFALRITEDILRNDLYTNTEIKRVFNSHIEANRGRLEEERMQQQIQELALELNLAYDDSSPIHYEIMCFTPESYKCECAEPQPEPELENDCTCGSVQSVPVSFNESKRSSKSSDGSDTDYETNRPEGKRRRHRRRKRSNEYTSRLREFAPVVPSTSMIMHLRSHLLHQSRGSLLEQFPYKNTSRLRDTVKSMKDKKKSTTSILSAKNGPTYQCTSCQCGGKDGPKSPEVATRDEGVPNIVHDSQVSRSTAKNIPGATPVKGRTSSKLSKVVSISQEVITEDTKKPLENKPSSESRNVIPLDSHKSSESVKPEVPSSIVNSSQQSTQSTKKKKASPRALAKARAKASSKSSIKPKTEKDGKISASAILTKPSDSNMSTHNPSVDLSCIANKSKEVSIGSFKGKRTSRGQYKDRSKESFDGNRSERRRTIDSNRSDRKLYRQQRKRRSKSSVTSDSQMRGSIDSKSINSGEQPTQYHSKYSKNDDEESFMSQMQCSQIDKERKLKSSQEKLNTLHEVSSGEIKKKCTCATDNEEYFMSHMQCPRTCKAMLKRKLKISNEKSLKAETNKKCTCVKDETDTFLSRLQCPQTCNAMLKPSIVRDKLHEVTNNTNTIKQVSVCPCKSKVLTECPVTSKPLVRTESTANTFMTETKSMTSMKSCVCDSNAHPDLKSCLCESRVPTTYDAPSHISAIYSAVIKDKNNKEGADYFVLPGPIYIPHKTIGQLSPPTTPYYPPGLKTIQVAPAVVDKFSAAQVNKKVTERMQDIDKGTQTKLKRVCICPPSSQSHSPGKCSIGTCSVRDRDDLLLSEEYDNEIPPSVAQFFPTIATQTSSSDFLMIEKLLSYQAEQTTIPTTPTDNLQPQSTAIKPTLSYKSKSVDLKTPTVSPESYKAEPINNLINKLDSKISNIPEEEEIADESLEKQSDGKIDRDLLAKQQEKDSTNVDKDNKALSVDSREIGGSNELSKENSRTEDEDASIGGTHSENSVNQDNSITSKTLKQNTVSVSNTMVDNCEDDDFMKKLDNKPTMSMTISMEQRIKKVVHESEVFRHPEERATEWSTMTNGIDLTGHEASLSSEDDEDAVVAPVEDTHMTQNEFIESECVVPNKTEDMVTVGAPSDQGLSI